MKDDESIGFEHVFQTELDEIDASRRMRSLTPTTKSDEPFQRAEAGQLVGLALSGGGVRSATFSLGVLQALARHRLLRQIDYLSSTGAGSYIAGWLAAWIKRSNFDEVETQLGGSKPATLAHVEAAEIQRLRRSTSQILSRRSWSWLRNVVLNLFVAASALGAFSLLASGLIGYPLRILGSADPFSVLGISVLAAAALLALTATIFIGFASLVSDPEPSSSRIVRWFAVGSAFAAGVLMAVWIFALARSNPVHVDSLLSSRWWLVGAVWLASMCVAGSRPKKGHWKDALIGMVSAMLSGCLGGLLLFGLALLSSSLTIGQQQTFLVPLVIVVFVVTGLAHTLFIGNRMSPQQLNFAAGFGKSLSGGALIWTALAVLWWEPNAQPLYQKLLTLTLLLVIFLIVGGGLLKAVVARDLPEWVRTVLHVITHVAPFAFALGFAPLIMWPLRLLGQFPAIHLRNCLIQIVSASIFLAISAGLIWLVRTNEYWKQTYYRKRVTSVYSGSENSYSDSQNNDIRLRSLTTSSKYLGPYPLFSAEFGAVETDQAGKQRRVLPFTLAPLYCGFGPPGTVAYRPTDEFAGGLPVGTVTALSEPFRRDLTHPPSAAAAFLWQLFDVRSGSWVGNPSRNDTWRIPSPRVGFFYPLIERLLVRDGQPGYIHLTGGGQFDNLGIYQLAKRRCRFIIACDATEDPRAAFEDFVQTIQNCRTHLSTEITIDIGPIKSRKNHCQIGLIHYPDKTTGLMLYMRPSLTGDEALDLAQYANAHPEFPRASVPIRGFDEDDFETYRNLGRHVVESVFPEVRESSTQQPIDQIFLAIRQRLQPDFKDLQTGVESAMMRLPDSPPPDLVEAIASGECVLCAGAGLAAQAGLPTWSPFFEGLLRFAREKDLASSAEITALTASLAAGELEAVADELTHQIPREVLLTYIRSTIVKVDPSKAHQLLAELPLLGVVNTYLDELLAVPFAHRDARLFVPADSAELVSVLQMKKFFVLNVFGAVSQPSSLLLTTKELRAVLFSNPQLKQLLSTLLLRYSAFFVGLTLEGIRNFLEALELSQTPERPHYALIAHHGQLDLVKQRYLERTYNLRIIAYQPQPDYADLPGFLETLQVTVREKAPKLKAARLLALKSVTLSNIGPFESLHLDLTPSWNVLLGDNGVGKTVVLRAIAAALCGDKAAPTTVSRLLRSGSNEGLIRLQVESREYTVKLERESDGNVRIVSTSLSPITYDNWLVLGFPALRSIPWERSKGPGTLKQEKPTVKDLLPILKGDPDSRIADIRQWLINLDYASSSEPSPSRSKRLLSAFFDVLQQLTPDLRLKLHSIDRKTMDIRVETDGGVVPLEAVSQGTGSVMSWIGTLLERLWEVGNASDPTKGAALVLIDELDAHMHPKWQQLFVDAFRKQFPGVQVIATTHSPLLVGSLKPGELWLVHRVPLRSEIYGVVEPLEREADGTQEIVIRGPEVDSDDGQKAPVLEQRKYRIPPGIEVLVKEGQVVEEREPLTKGNLLLAERIAIDRAGWRADQILTSPLFSLKTTVGSDLGEVLSEYTDLIALDNPTAEQSKRLVDLAAKLGTRLPEAQEREAARKAYSLIRDVAKHSLDNLLPEERREVITELKAQLIESVTGSGRSA